MILLVATRSHGKLVEIRHVLSSVPDLQVLDLNDAGIPVHPDEDHLEPHDTFEENALSKARHFHARSGLPTVADDSGLEVPALGGEPGVRSKRYAPGVSAQGRELDEVNNRHLLGRLSGRPPADRAARFVCVAALVDGERPPLVCRGEAPGVILEAPRGSGGFGYDPLFLDPELEKTFAEIGRDEKNRRSHRGRAFRLLAEKLKERP
ncbi:MAG: non-canonical purine NTP pyrophosphatase [Gemmatimonadetes bacterium]|nr:non-canonical purine NTP pyrophosphatase [Gemmatimonadota bacterium]